MATVMTTTFELAGADGGPLRGDVRTQSGGDGRPAVVICHGFKGSKDHGFLPKLADRLAHAGLTAVSFNFSGSGVGPDGEGFSEPERFGHATFSRDLEDIGTVCRALADAALGDGVAPPTALGLFGFSRGGGMAVAHAADHGGVAALVTWAAIGTVRRWPDDVMARWGRDGRIDVPNGRTGEVLPLYTDVLQDIQEHETGRLDLVAAASRVRVPWLIMHGDDDETVPVAEARRLYEGATGEEVRLHLIPGGSHGMGGRHPWSGSTPELDLAMGETVGWFARYLF